MSKLINLIDIGALDGPGLPWTTHANQVGFVLSFEPNEEVVIQETRIKYNTAVWNHDGQAPFYVSGANGSGSSLLSQNFAWVQEHFDEIKHQGNTKLNETWAERSQITKTTEVTVKRLDTILEELKPQIPDVRFHFLKSDTQSGEGYVLQGAEQFIRTDCLGLELELFRYPLYQDILLNDEVTVMLNDWGFVRAGWTGYKNSFHSQYDALFLKKKPADAQENAIVQQILRLYSPQGKEKLIKQPSLMDKAKRRLKKWWK